MTNPHEPNEARLSTADLAAASDRADQNAAPPEQPPVRGDRDVTPQPGVRADVPTAAEPERPSPLFAENEADDLRRRWSDIQTGFVDEPRQAVERADALVATAMKRLAEIFAQERANLEQQWARGGDVSTEDLRLALRRYRGFFDRLLSV
jgi:hypothetical protein